MSKHDPLESIAGKRVGIVAGWGSFPVHAAERLRANRCDVITAGLKGHAGDEVRRASSTYRPFGVLKLGAMLRYFRKAQVEHVVFAGKVFKDRIVHNGRGWVGHAPDLTCIRVLGGSFITRTRDGRDDTILTAIADEFARQNMPVLTIHQCAPDLLVEAGQIGSVRASRNQTQDIDFGWNIAKQMGRLDVGQSIIVKDQMVLAVEAVEGTDALIRRSESICPRGGFSLVKVAKPGQDMRFDVPTIGVQTVKRMAACGGRAIGIDADKTILVDRDETIAAANELRIAIVALRDDQIRLVGGEAPATGTTVSVSRPDATGIPSGLSRSNYPHNRYRAA